MTVSENTYKLAQLIQEDKRRQAADLLATAPVDVRMMLNKHADTLLSLACAQHNFPLADTLMEKGAPATAALSRLIQCDSLVRRYMALRRVDTHVSEVPVLLQRQNSR